MKPIVAAIGTTDPWNAVGLGLDVRALAECGARATMVVAAVSAQDKDGVHALHPVPPSIVAAQLRALADASIAAFRIGALPSLEVGRVVAEHLAHASVPVVYDPVFAASAGGTLVAAGEYVALVRTLLPYVTVVTPNVDEAQRLTNRTIAGSADAAEAARELVRLGARAALVKGGDLGGPATDVLYDGDAISRFEAPRLPGNLRGTGCLLADALAAALARGVPLPVAIERARTYVRRKFTSARRLDGMRVAD